MQPVEPLPASTLVLLRWRKGLEVYLTRRNPNLVFLGGYYVFPGGSRDQDDYSEPALSRMHAKNVKLKAAEIESQEPEDKKLGYYAAAIREAFEEAGVLIACQKGGREMEFNRELQAELFKLRSLIHEGRAGFLEVMRELDLYFDLDRLHWFSRWVTPEFSPRRFDTRFFSAALPQGQDPSGFPEEVDEELWVSPEDAIAQCESGKLLMIPPTIASLARLRGCQSLEQALKK